ncbi:MAG: MFS transporter [Thermodesulfobacteriota bacterium]
MRALSPPQTIKGYGRKTLYRWCIVIIGLAVLSVSYGLRWSFGIFCNPVSSEFGWSRTSFSLAMSIHMLTFAFLSPLAGSATDRFGYKPVLLWGSLLFGSGFLLLRFIGDLWSLYLVYGVFMAVGSCGLSLVPNSLMVGSFFEKKGTAIGITTTGTSIGPFFIAPFATYLVLAFGWRDAFTILGAMILVVLGPLVQIAVKKTPGDKSGFLSGPLSEPGKSAVGRFREKVFDYYLGSLQAGDGRFHQMLLAYFACCFSYYLICFHLPGVFAERNIPEMITATVLGVTTTSGVLGKLLSGAAADRAGTAYPMIFCLVMEALGMLGMMVSVSLPGFYCSAIVLGFSFGGIITLVPVSILSSLDRKLQGRAMGTMTFSGAVGGSMGPFVGGVSYDATHSFVLGLVIGTALLFWASVWPVLARNRVGITDKNRSEEIQHRTWRTGGGR